MATQPGSPLDFFHSSLVDSSQQTEKAVEVRSAYARQRDESLGFETAEKYSLSHLLQVASVEGAWRVLVIIADPVVIEGQACTYQRSTEHRLQVY